MIKKKKNEVYALRKHIQMSAHKARRVIEQIRGRSYEETLMILKFMPYQATYPILKLVSSAVTNAIQNRGFNKAHLVITQAKVNEGTTRKKRRPRARGRNCLIKKQTCHITILLKDESFYHKGYPSIQDELDDIL